MSGQFYSYIKFDTLNVSLQVLKYVTVKYFLYNFQAISPSGNKLALGF